MKYDVVFWAHGTNETDRYLPIMAALKAKGINALLFFQNYKADDGLSSFHQRIIKRFCLDVKDYSDVFTRHFLLQFLSFTIKFLPSSLAKRKMIGLRSKILSRAIDRNSIKRFLESLGHIVNIFDFIEINKDTKYPYGSYFIKDISSHMGIRNIAVPHGTSVYVADHLYPKDTKLDFDKILVSDERYRKYLIHNCVDPEVEVIALGDPRFDSKWKITLKEIACTENLHDENEFKGYTKVILYLCPNLEQIKFDSIKYENIKDVASAVSSIKDAVLLIKPHPRYRNEHIIKKAMKEINFDNFKILSDCPGICFSEIADFIVTSATSALFDFLPEELDKIVIYDNFMQKDGLKNLFEGYVRLVNDIDGFKECIENDEDFTEMNGKTEIKEFCKSMVGGDGSTDDVVNNYCSYIVKELEEYSE